jgi:hypothetical protein
MGTNFVVADDWQDKHTKWMMGSPLRRNPIPSMAVVRGRAGNYVLAASANKYSSAGASGLLALDEAKQEWIILLMDAKGETGGIAISQCRAESASSWAHLRLKGRSFIIFGKENGAHQS